MVTGVTVIITAAGLFFFSQHYKESFYFLTIFTIF